MDEPRSRLYEPPNVLGRVGLARDDAVELALLEPDGLLSDQIDRRDDGEARVVLAC